VPHFPRLTPWEKNFVTNELKDQVRAYQNNTKSLKPRLSMAVVIIFAPIKRAKPGCHNMNLFPKSALIMATLTGNNDYISNTNAE